MRLRALRLPVGTAVKKDAGCLSAMQAPKLEYRAEGEEMTRDEAISIIEQLYPADSQYQDTSAIGRQLLQRAQDEVAGWRTAPDAVVIRYAELCEAEENKQTRELLKGGKR